MTEIIFEYIKILLPRHKCVTLPGLGAFILNQEAYGTSDLKEGEIIPPSSIITFNSRLQHDDGVLSSHIQSINGITYDKASKELANTIKGFRANLLINKEILCGSLGKIELIDSSIIFTQNKNYIFPLHYGLSPVALTTITSITEDISKEVKTISLKKRIITISASAAAVLLLVLPSTSITDNISLNNEQQAGYLKSLVTTSNPITIEEAVAEKEAIIEEISVKTKEAALKAIEQPTTRSNSERIYHLIIGGESTANRAEKALNRFKSEGFSDAQILESPQRYRISVESFENKREAEQYVIQFRKNNPKYESAWIHSRRN